MISFRSKFLLSRTPSLIQVFQYQSSHNKILTYFNQEKHLKEMLEFIPSKYLESKKYNSLESLYLIDLYIARNICQHMLPCLKEGHQVIAETGAGLGLVASELLDNKVKNVRLYECCHEFRAALHDFNNVYPNRVELFKQNFFHLGRISNQDKYDRGNRVSQMLKNVPKKKWQEGPCMTIFGCMVNRNFINYLLKVIAMQTDIFTHGRIQLFVVMRPSDYIKLTADSKTNLHTYSASSVLFQIFFQHELLEKYPRQAFLPWENKLRTRIKARYSQTIDVDQLYFVKIVPKRTLPVSTEHLLPLHYFVRQLFGRGTNRVLPTIEKWLPGFGKYLIVPSKKYTHYYDDISIFTMFGELNPLEILSLFQEMTEYEGYKGSAFEAMVQSELVKYETRESDNSLLLEDSLDQLDVEDLEEKFD